MKEYSKQLIPDGAEMKEHSSSVAAFSAGGGLPNKLRQMFGFDIRSLAFFRVGLAIATLGDLVERSLDLRDHYSDEGIFPRALLLESYVHPYTVLIHGINGTPTFLSFVFAAHAFCALCLLIGYRTKLFTFLTWMFLVSLQARNPFLNHGGDLYFRLLFFYANFLPLGGCWSVDSALAAAQAKTPPKPRNPRVLTGGTVALIAQIAMMYLVSTEHKTGSEWREDFTATWYALQLDYYKTTVAQILMLFPKFLEFLTWAVFQWEFFGPFMFSFPVFTDQFRLVAAVGFFLMHFGFIMCLRLGFFFWVCTVALFPMLPPFVWDFFLNRFRKKNEKRGPSDLHLQYDDNSRFSKNLTFLVASFLAIPFSNLTPFQSASFDETEKRTPKKDLIWLYSENSSGKFTTNFQALKMTYEHSPLSTVLWPFVLIFRLFNNILPNIVVKTFSHVSTTYFGNLNAKSVANKTHTPEPMIPPYQRDRKHRVKVGHIFVMLVVIYCLSWNMGNLGSPYHFSPEHNWIGLVLHVDQFWGMFSPHPPKAHWYYVFQAELEDGTELEIFKDRGLFRWEGNAPFSYEKPNPFHESFKNHRWYKFFEMGFNGERHENIRLNFGRWVCREWNARHEGNDKLYHYKVHFLLEWQALYGERNPPSDQVLWDHICYNKPEKI